ncbi:amidase [Acidothermaceae bacterium B102]|nr:amidase [Acidothermaceae bacterium B102]
MRLESPFVPWASGLSLEPTSAGVLDGQRLAVKDVFDLGGYPTGGGNPTWLESHPSAAHDAEAVATLRAAGARVVGKTHTDELAYSLAGSNYHYGDLDNPRVPGSTPGGSSSGSAVAVASGLADLALGTDTAGSVRVPAAWCGLYGLRPTWGRISVTGAMALGPTHDTVGVMARSLDLLTAAAGVLLRPADATEADGFLVPQSLWSEADPEVVAALTPTLTRLGELLPVHEAAELPSAASMVQTFTVTQGAQVWRTFGEWVSAADPELGPDVHTRMTAASQLAPDEVATAQQRAAEIRAQLAETLQHRIMLLPTVPVTAPTPEQARSPEVRNRLLALTVAASIGGLPGLTLPVDGPDGLPVGLCLVGAPGSDEQLLALAAAL